MMPVCRLTSLLVFAFAFELPVHVVGGGLRGLLERPSSLQPLQQPPPATADIAFAQLGLQAPAPAPGPGGAPGPAPGPAPAPVTLPPEPKIPKITEKTCKDLVFKLEDLIGAPSSAPPGPAPAPAAVLLQDDSMIASKPDPHGKAPSVECEIYAFVAKKPAGCRCFLQAPPPPAAPPKVAGCPTVPDAVEGMGITDTVQLGPFGFGGQTGAWKSTTCLYRQWINDPTATGLTKDYQVRYADAATEKYIKDTYKASLRNAKNTASAFWALTPVPWLLLYPTEAPPPAAAPGPAPGPAVATTPNIIHWPDPPTTPAMFTTPAPYGVTTAPTYFAVR